MKIIKQNDSAGGLIFRQNTNGKAMKQNYNFGKGLKFNTTGASPLITIPLNIQVSAPFTIGLYCKLTDVPTTQYDLHGALNNDTLRLFQRTGTSPNFNRITNVIFGSKTLFSSEVKNGYFMAIAGEEDIIRYSDGTGITTNLSTNIGFPITSYRFYFRNNASVKALRSDLLIFDRMLSVDELLYLSNNGLGNEPISTFALKHRYKLDKAEISDGKIVVIDDIQGNNGVFSGLPAGTLEDQLAYANANLFERW